MNELNFHSKRRLELAQKISDRIRQFEGLQAIIVAGSVARGYEEDTLFSKQ